MEKHIAVTRSSMPSYEEYCEEIKDLWNTHWLTNMGIKHRELEERLKEKLGCPFVSLYTNGHLALEHCLTALELSGEVITTPFTFASTTNAIVRSGLTPVFCDIKEDDFTMDPALIESKITERTVAIMPVHVYGNICDFRAIADIAKKHSLKVIYDAAHAFGESVGNMNVAMMGDVSMFSFHSTKVYNTIEGGALCYTDASLKTKLESYKNFGMAEADQYPFVGGNAKMNEFQAAMGLCNLRHLSEEIAKREKAYSRYKERLASIKGIVWGTSQRDVDYNYAYLPVVFDGYKMNRDQVFDLLLRNNINARKYFYPLTSEFVCYKGRGYAGACDTPVAKHISDSVLCLPLYADLTIQEVDAICDIILNGAI